MVVWFTTTNVSAIGAYHYSNPANGEMCLRQDYVIKFVSDLRQVSSTNKSYGHYITEILFKVALNTITLTLEPVKHELPITPYDILQL
jgi:hypothetical protein